MAVTAITFDQFCVRAAVYAEHGVTAARRLRPGQCAYNALEDVRPDLAAMIRGMAIVDPFYNDGNLPAFYAWLAEHWNT